jgi:hypothetical protein
MTDVVRYKVNVFLEQRDKVTSELIPCDIKNKIHNILSNYSCFGSQQQYSHHHPNRNSIHTNNQHHANYSQYNSHGNNYYQYYHDQSTSRNNHHSNHNTNHHSNLNSNHHSNLNHSNSNTSLYGVDQSNKKFEFVRSSKVLLTKTRIIKAEDPDTIQTISRLNKLSKNNYDKLSKLIVDSITSKNFEVIVNKLFQISYIQSTYADIYIKLFHSIISSKTSSLTSELIKEIQEYIAELIHGILTNKGEELGNVSMKLLTHIINKNSMNDDQFCDINKKCKYLLGQILIINMLILVKNKVLSPDVCNTLRECMMESLIQKNTKNFDNDLYLDVCQITYNHANLSANIIDEIQNHLDEGTNTHNFIGRKKIHFKLIDILDKKLWKRR